MNKRFATVENIKKYKCMGNESIYWGQSFIFDLSVDNKKESFKEKGE